MAYNGASSKATARMVTEDGVFTENESSPLLLDTVERAEINTEKDPRIIARRYQLELCEKAMTENVIVCLGTGCGKTHIAVLIMYELRHLITKPQKEICVFLAPTVALVQQQAKVIGESTDFKVGVFTGDTKHLKSHQEWNNELEKYEVFVMIPQIFLRSLCHCFIRMDLIALLVFDECHHAQPNSNHPYAEIMRLFYTTDAAKLPRVFGMTASPVMGKGASREANVSRSINGLETLLHARVYSVDDVEGMESFIASPALRIHYYGPSASDTYNSNQVILNKLKECLLNVRNEANIQNTQSNNKTLNSIHNNTTISLETLGLWGALQAAKIMRSANHSEADETEDANESSGDDSVRDAYLERAVGVLSSASDLVKAGLAYDVPPPEELKEPLFSKKLQCLIEILSLFRVQQKMKCIIFVKRIITAKALSWILNKVESLASWKCDFLLGIQSGSRTTMNMKLEKFRSGECNLLIATKVGEEGLDIQTCCLVIRFDLPETVASFIQSRGRARMRNSEYALLVDRGNKKELELIEKFIREEDRMNSEISDRTSAETLTSVEEAIYKVGSSGAIISSRYSVDLLHHYCQKLPSDEFFNPKPEFQYHGGDGEIFCNIIMPSNAPIHEVVGAPSRTVDGAKKYACLKAVEELHKIGAISDYLLLEHSNADKNKEASISADLNSCAGEESREELHEMLVPSTLKSSYSESENLKSDDDIDDFVYLHAYYINLNPIPKDREYRDFCLFVKRPLPEEAERMKLELELAHGRSVMTDLVPNGTIAFNKHEIHLAKNYQEVFFKVLLDRLELTEDFICLGRNDFCWSISRTFYIMLPIILHDNRNTMTVDWEIIQRCLSSAIFRTPSGVQAQESSPHFDEVFLASGHVADIVKIEEGSPEDNELLLANGTIPKRDIVGSLVYVMEKKLFYFVNAIKCRKNGRISSDMDNVQLAHSDQPLLELKPLPNCHSLLLNRHSRDSAPQELKEYFEYSPAELCVLKIIGFSKDIGSTVSLLPSIMHHLENLLVAVELRDMMCSSFPEGAEVSVERVLEAITTEKCRERFSLERLETLGDSFLKFAVGRHLFLRHKALDEGELTRIRSGMVNNNNLHKLALEKNLQVYIRDQPLNPPHFFAPGRPCKNICNEETHRVIHSVVESGNKNLEDSGVISCSKGHHMLRNKIIADVVEALVGAFLVDGGFTAAAAFLKWMGMSVDFEESEIESVLVASKRYMPLSTEIDIAALETELHYHFHYKGLLLQALVHPSYDMHGGGCYQRLEFLGDAVLDYLITSYLYSAYPELRPGQLTDLRSVCVNNKTFADVAVRKYLYKYIICNSSSLSKAVQQYVDYGTAKSDDLENISENGPPMCPKVLGDLIESSTGAILLDTGFNLNSVWRIVLRLVDPVMSVSSMQLSPLRELRELCQSLSWDPLKFSSSEKGRKFIVKAEVSGKDFYRTLTVTYPNKKEATRIAAERLLATLKAEGYASKSKSLQEVLKSSCKMEPKLIGFNETPFSFSGLVRSNDVDVQGPSSSNMTVKDYAQKRKSRSIGALPNKSAKSLLYELCAKQYWKSPVFECLNEEGPSHLKLFKMKVIVAVHDGVPKSLECEGDLLPTKKAAGENAAEGAVWFLKKKGIFADNDSTW